MSIRSNIRKILVLALALAAGSGILVLLAAAISKKNHRSCTGVEVSIHGPGKQLFLNRQDVLHIIMPGKNIPAKGRALASFNLKKMEAALEQNCWVHHAQVFFDNNAMLRINVEERTPIARVFTVSGNSFYIDSSGRHLPLSNTVILKLPVFSNFPAEGERLYGADSALMQQIKRLAPFILSHPFWMAQLSQVDITPERHFEMLPVIGRHTIVFGDGAQYEEKFHRLFLFYQQVGARVGFDTYSIINVAFDKQVVATKKGATGKIDSLQALKNIQKLIETSKQLANDTVSTMVDNNIAANDAAVPTLTILKNNPKDIAKDSASRVISTIPQHIKKNKPAQQAKPVLHAAGNRQPKAIMKKGSG